MIIQQYMKDSNDIDFSSITEVSDPTNPLDVAVTVIRPLVLCKD